MSKSSAYARWLNAMAIARKESSDGEFDGCEEILAYISVREESKKSVKITDLVQSLMFGTGPTIHRKVSSLTKRGLIDISVNKDDARAKNLKLTKSGEDLLKERTKQMVQMLKS